MFTVFKNDLEKIGADLSKAKRETLRQTLVDLYCLLHFGSKDDAEIQKVIAEDPSIAVLQVPDRDPYYEVMQKAADGRRITEVGFSDIYQAAFPPRVERPEIPELPAPEPEKWELEEAYEPFKISSTEKQAWERDGSEAEEKLSEEDLKIELEPEEIQSIRTRLALAKAEGALAIDNYLLETPKADDFFLKTLVQKFENILDELQYGKLPPVQATGTWDYLQSLDQDTLKQVKTIVPRLAFFRAQEKAMLDRFRAPPSWFETWVLGVNPQASESKRPHAQLKSDHAPSAKFPKADFPPRTFHPIGYEPGGPKPRYALESIQHMWSTDLKYRDRLVGVRKPIVTWFKWPGWRLGVWAAGGLILADKALGWGVKESFEHHHADHSTYNPHEHYMYGVMDKSSGQPKTLALNHS